MGLAASQARFLQLTTQKSNLEFQGQQVNQERTILANQMDEIAEDMSELFQLEDFSVDNADYLQLQLDLESAHNQDKLLEMELKDVDTQHTAVQTEIDSVNKVIDKNIDMTYKTFA